MPFVGLTHTEGLPRPLLKRLVSNTERDRVPIEGFSTTELIAPTRLVYLKRTVPYTERASSLIYRVLGQAADTIMDDDEGEVLTQERLKDEVNSGQFDRYEGDTGLLMDWKMTGWYKVRRCMQTGMWLGWKEACIQINDYRMKLEAIGFPVKRMELFVFIRDGGAMARKAGVTESWYRLEVGRISDRWLKRYFTIKKERIQAALMTGEAPDVCKASERWSDKRCKGYCPVSFACEYGKQFQV